jgi:hypothetical protein
MGLLENHFRFSQNSSSADVAGGSPADAHPTRDVSLALSEARTFIGSVTGEVSQHRPVSIPGPTNYATVSTYVQPGSKRYWTWSSRAKCGRILCWPNEHILSSLWCESSHQWSNMIDSLLDVKHDVEDMDGATTCSKPSGPIEYDSDVIYALPAPDVIAGFVEYYFNYCQWIYHHVWRNSFRPRWDDYLRGQNSDRLVLATCCGILALTT